VSSYALIACHAPIDYVGGDKNISRALGLYDKAAAMGSIRAFNGLGYVYFFGHGEEAPLNKVSQQSLSPAYTECNVW
jgi:TPR repeat protein